MADYLCEEDMNTGEYIGREDKHIAAIRWLLEFGGQNDG